MKRTLLIQKNAPAFACLLLIVLFPILQVHAQDRQPHFGIKAGSATSKCSVKSTYPVISTNSKNSATIGLFVHFPLTKRLSIRPGIDYVTRGAIINKTYYEYISWTMVEGIRFADLDLPINLLYDIPIGPYKIFAGGGPTISYMLNQYNNKGVPHTDIGANIMAGFEWPSGVEFMINYTHGLRNVSSGRWNETSLKNYYLGVTLGYWFSLRRVDEYR
jgi:hypothetical protein